MSQRRKSGDWDCSNCGNLNFARRTECRMCKTKRNGSKKNIDQEIGNAVIVTTMYFLTKMYAACVGKKPKTEFKRKSGDWECRNCKDINFASRIVCRKCSTPHSDIANKDDANATAQIFKELEKERNRLLELQKQHKRKEQELLLKTGGSLPEYWKNQDKTQVMLHPVDEDMEKIIKKLVKKTTISDYIGQLWTIAY